MICTFSTRPYLLKISSNSSSCSRGAIPLTNKFDPGFSLDLLGSPRSSLPVSGEGGEVGTDGEIDPDEETGSGDSLIDGVLVPNHVLFRGDGRRRYRTLELTLVDSRGELPEPFASLFQSTDIALESLARDK
jgi:hypothetical protein